jgi:hypothetical protein
LDIVPAGFPNIPKVQSSVVNPFPLLRGCDKHRQPTGGETLQIETMPRCDAGDD